MELYGKSYKSERPIPNPNKEKTIGIYIGRFQPFHVGHEIICRTALEECETLIILIGSHKKSRRPKDRPFTYEERKKMILRTLHKFENRIMIAPIRDHINDEDWAVDVQNSVHNMSCLTVGKTPNEHRLYGYFKDETSEYLNWFPQWTLRNVITKAKINGTDLRHSYFQGRGEWMDRVSPSVAELMINFKKTDEAKSLFAEYEFNKDYRDNKRWADFPYIANTVDNVVIKNGHILVITRKLDPGKGKFALPGGFLKINQRAYDSAVAELYEETSIDVSKQLLKASVVDYFMEDDPNRGDRCRTITHVFYYNLKFKGPLPNVKPGDDAELALWLPLATLPELEDRFYDDHYQLIQRFVSKI